MKTDPNEPAFGPNSDGLTKREHIAALALQGILAGGVDRSPTWTPGEPAARAIQHTDALIARLNEGE